MHPAFNGGNTVGVSMDAFVVTGIPLQGDIQHLPFVLFFIMGNLGE